AAPVAPARDESGGGDGSSGGRTRKRALLAVAGLAVAALLVGGGLLLTGAWGGTDAYKLTTPRTVGGDYQRDGKGETGDGAAFGDSEVPGMKATADVSADYRNATARLNLGGAYGQVKDPDTALTWLMEKSGDNLADTGAEPKGVTREFSPSRFDGDILTCQEYTISSVPLALCGWGDGSTVGLVSYVPLEAGGASADGLDLEKTAELTARVREDARTEAD
ncbi:hypothetical protein KDA82_31515, partial [Streptomyces daliensis]|nr:hypothetical protein [Streptomyces daliensis]